MKITNRLEIQNEGDAGQSREDLEMACAVVLTALNGTLAGERFVFDEPATCLIGRSTECDLQLPGEEHATVSRRHCVLEIDPPRVRVRLRDLGSTNGTYVNGEKVQPRPQDEATMPRGEEAEPDRDLRDGDEIRLGPTVFRVSILIFPTSWSAWFTRELRQQPLRADRPAIKLRWAPTLGSLDAERPTDRFISQRGVTPEK